AKLDGKTPRTLGEYFGDFNVVLFAPEDLRVPRGSPSGRRRFLDRSVFNRQVAFLADAQRYARVLKSRNVLLRPGPPAPPLLAFYAAPPAAAGPRVLAARLRTLEELRPRFAESYEAITQSARTAELRYETPLFVQGASPPVEPSSSGPPETPNEDELRNRLSAALEAGRRRDIARRQTGVGPHVDDVVFLLGGHEARGYASQGQLRALVLAWKTAEMALLRDVHGEAPILLLDDVSSELDAKRNAFLFDFLERIDCQCFVTTTHPRHIHVTQNRKDFRIVEGVLQGS